MLPNIVSSFLNTSLPPSLPPLSPLIPSYLHQLQFSTMPTTTCVPPKLCCCRFQLHTAATICLHQSSSIHYLQSIFTASVNDDYESCLSWYNCAHLSFLIQQRSWPGHQSGQNRKKIVPAFWDQLRSSAGQKMNNSFSRQRQTGYF